jgi:hypothetical protein
MTYTVTSQNIDLPSRSRAGGKDNTRRPNQTTKMALSRKPFGIGHMFIKSFLLRMTGSMTSQNIVLSSWDTLYMAVWFVCFCLILLITYSYCYVYVFLLFYKFRLGYSVLLCCSVYCLCVNMYCTTATGCQPNCS